LRYGWALTRAESAICQQGYGADKEPPRLVTAVSAVQHVGVIAIFMIYPLIIGRWAGLPAEEITTILQMGMIALAVATLLQAPEMEPRPDPRRLTVIKVPPRAPW
jgi:xanthine/uracil permease